MISVLSYPMVAIASRSSPPADCNRLEGPRSESGGFDLVGFWHPNSYGKNHPLLARDFPSILITNGKDLYFREGRLKRSDFLCFAVVFTR